MLQNICVITSTLNWICILLLFCSVCSQWVCSGCQCWSLHTNWYKGTFHHSMFVNSVVMATGLNVATGTMLPSNSWVMRRDEADMKDVWRVSTKQQSLLRAWEADKNAAGMKILDWQQECLLCLSRWIFVMFA